MNDSPDPMAPRAGAAPTLCGSLELVTLMTNDASAAIRFLTQAMQLRVASDVECAGDVAAARCNLWGLPPAAKWRELTFEGSSEPPGVRVRVIAMPGGELIRPDMESRLTGGLSIGFPAADLEATLSRVTALGYESTAGIVPLTITRPDGSSYVSGEILFRGPEQSYMLVVGRPAGMAPVGPIDPATGMGGGAYSAIVVPDAAREIAFYREVLGWEARQDIVLTTSGPAGGLGLDAGTRFRFVQLFAPGAATGYVCLLDMMDAGRPNPVAPRLPNRGIVMWSFGTHAFDRVAAQAQAAGRGTTAAAWPRFAEVAGRRTLTVLTPAGLMLEITDRA